MFRTHDDGPGARDDVAAALRVLGDDRSPINSRNEGVDADEELIVRYSAELRQKIRGGARGPLVIEEDGLVADGYADGRKLVIPKSILLTASQTALDYNRRKSRSGAFWEGNYHATAVETGLHFQNCLVYIDLNMVRAGVVEHPMDWPFCGFQEIDGRRARYCLIEKKLLMDLLGVADPVRLRMVYRDWIMDALKSNGRSRNPIWTESVAVGREAFIERVRADLGLKVLHKEKIESAAGLILKEPHDDYLNKVFLCKKNSFKD